MNEVLVVHAGPRRWLAGLGGDRAPRWTANVDPMNPPANMVALREAGAVFGAGLHAVFVLPMGATLVDRFGIVEAATRGVLGCEAVSLESEAVAALGAVGRDSGVALCVDRDECRACAVREGGVVLEHTTQVGPLGPPSARHPDALEVLFRPTLVLGWKEVVPWSVQRLLWLGRKHAFAECPFGGMPKDLVRLLARYCCTEYLGIDAILANCLAAVQHGELRRQMRGSLVLCGENSLCAGLAERLRERLGEKCDVLAVEGRELLAFTGAAAMERPHDWITREDFERRGVKAITDPMTYN